MYFLKITISFLLSKECNFCPRYNSAGYTTCFKSVTSATGIIPLVDTTCFKSVTSDTNAFLQADSKTTGNGRCKVVLVSSRSHQLFDPSQNIIVKVILNKKV